MFVVTVSKILHSTSGVETWVTSDGRAYFVRLQECSQMEETVVDSNNGDEPNGHVSVNFWFHEVCPEDVFLFQRPPWPTAAGGMKTMIFLQIFRIYYRLNIVGRGPAFITSKFLAGCKSLGISRVTDPIVEHLFIWNHVEPWRSPSTQGFR